MTAADGFSGGSWRRFNFRQSLAATAATLLLGFLLIQTPPAQALFGYIAVTLAVCAAFVLGFAGDHIVRAGVEIRDTVSGHAVAVTSACDGSGLLVSFTAAFVLLASFSPRRRSWGTIAAAALVCVLLFNLARILALFQSIGFPSLMTAGHLYATPLMSAVLVAALALFARRVRPGAAARSPLRWGMVALAAALAWYWCREVVTCATVTPLANLLLWLTQSKIAHRIECTGPAAELVTNAPLQPVSAGALTVPFHPEDFTLALPLIVASLALARQPAPIIRGLSSSLILFAAGMALAAVTTGHEAAAAAGVRVLRLGAIIQSYNGPGPVILSLLKAAQDAVVHFNLFLLPLVLVMVRDGPPAARPSATGPSRGPRPAARRRRSR